MDLISVIIPAFNAATRIKFTLESVIAQSYPNIEIILVNDASTDNTEELAREILERSGKNFKLITHGLNKGECASRNTGIKNSTGKFISFLDADDMLEKNFISSLHEAISKNNCDITFSNVIERFIGKNFERQWRFVKSAPYVASGEDFILSKHVPAVWTCLYSRELIKKYNLLFHEGCTAGGDIEFITKALCVAKKVTFVSDCLYIYIHHEEMGSVRDNNTSSKKILRYEHNTGANLRASEFLARHGSKILKTRAKKILIPQSIIRFFNLAAMKNDRPAFNSLLKDSEALQNLKRALSLYTLLRKPEVFFKALAVLFTPSIYFYSRKILKK